MAVLSLDLDLEVFQGPFDLLLTLVLKEEVDLLEVDLAEIVLAYVEYLEGAGELDLEAATEFLVLIAALLELKSRMILPREEDEEIDLDRVEAADEQGLHAVLHAGAEKAHAIAHDTVATARDRMGVGPPS
jgi:segregation and condensation protein A